MYNWNVIMFAKSNGNPPRSETNIYWSYSRTQKEEMMISS